MAVNDFVSLLLGEAGGRNATERYNDMLHIASVVVNRAQATGRPVEDIMANSTEFNAWGKSLPAGTEQYRAIAEQAIQQVMAHGPVTNATFYATPTAKDNLPSNLAPATRTASHEFFTDPQNRSIGTANGYAQVSPISVQTVPPLPLSAPTPYGALDMRMEPFQAPYADLVPPTTAPREITPGAGLANLAPPAPQAPSAGYGSIAYAHPDRGTWDAGLTPETADSVRMMAAGTPRGASITSAYRSPSHSVEAQKATPGQHARGTAYDLDLRGKNEQERANAVERAMMSGATRLGSYTREPNMLHVDFAQGFAPTNSTVYAMHDRSNRNMSRAPDWFTQGMSQVTVPTPTARPEMPSVPTQPPAPNFAGGMSPRGAQSYTAPPSSLPAAPPAMPSVPSAPPSFPGQRATPEVPSGAMPFAPISAREMQERSMAMYNLGLPAIDAMLGDRQPPPPAPPMGPPQAPPPAPSPFRPDNLDYRGPQNLSHLNLDLPRSSPPPSPAVQRQFDDVNRALQPPMAPPQTVQPGVMPPTVNIPQVAQVPTQNPRNGYNDMKRGAMLGVGPALMAPGVAQMGRNARTNMQGGRINMFAGIPQAYRSAAAGIGSRLGNMFGGGSLPAPTPFSVGHGVGAIQSVIGGGQAPGATAYSRSDPNVSFSVNQYGLVERDDGRFSGVFNG